MNGNDRALTAFTMLGHATFHTYELAVPLFIVVWLDTFSTTAAFLVGSSPRATRVSASARFPAASSGTDLPRSG